MAGNLTADLSEYSGRGLVDPWPVTKGQSGFFLCFLLRIQLAIAHRFSPKHA